MARRTQDTPPTWRTYLCIVVSSFAGLAALFFFAGAVGVFDDPAGARVHFAIISVLLLGVFLAFNRLALSWGP